MKHWHNLEIDAVQSETSTELITSETRTSYQEKYGKNLLTESEKMML